MWETSHRREGCSEGCLELAWYSRLAGRNPRNPAGNPRRSRARFRASGVHVTRVTLPSTVVNCGGPGRPSAGRSRTIQQESRTTQSSRAPLALHQGVAVPDDEHGVGDGQAVAATRISTTAGPTRRRHHLRPTRTHACTHAPAAVVPARPRRSTLPGLLPVSHLRPIAEARAIDHAHSHRRAELRSSVSFFPSSSPLSLSLSLSVRLLPASFPLSLPPAWIPAARLDPAILVVVFKASSAFGGRGGRKRTRDTSVRRVGTRAIRSRDREGVERTQSPSARPRIQTTPRSRRRYARAVRRAIAGERSAAERRGHQATTDSPRRGRDSRAPVFCAIRPSHVSTPLTAGGRRRPWRSAGILHPLRPSATTEGASESFLGVRAVDVPAAVIVHVNMHTLHVCARVCRGNDATRAFPSSAGMHVATSETARADATLGAA